MMTRSSCVAMVLFFAFVVATSAQWSTEGATSSRDYFRRVVGASVCNNWTIPSPSGAAVWFSTGGLVVTSTGTLITNDIDSQKVFTLVGLDPVTGKQLFSTPMPITSIAPLVVDAQDAVYAFGKSSTNPQVSTMLRYDSKTGKLVSSWDYPGTSDFTSVTVTKNFEAVIGTWDYTSQSGTVGVYDAVKGTRKWYMGYNGGLFTRRQLVLEELDILISLTTHSDTGFLTANAISNGSFKWRFSGTGSEIVFNPVTNWLVTVNQTAYPTIQLIMIDPKQKSTRGSVVKSYVFAFGDCYYQLDSINVDATTGIIYGNCGHNFFALSPKADTVLWKFQPNIQNMVPGEMPGAAGGGLVVLPNRGGEIHVISAVSGKELWKDTFQGTNVGLVSAIVPPNVYVSYPDKRGTFMLHCFGGWSQ